ncbi:amino-acid N-acetyltransferase [Saccharopolyspora oryzae]|uniref:Amino-acid N-acetyltransferase n=1 Tax=Saccharopolyspora oryzae TaxID=2997343 RepID=A0ABT4URP0_9PSEU|nr:amino-acid N-acetyltransferase [Saccharopolyspora oryzae]MDA3624388.1 amino-acid N-acetyltransferase [Saccharopolyspora oryzae]
MNDYASSAIAIRRARIADVKAIKALVDTYAGEVLLAKNLVTLYEDIQEFWVAELTEADQPARIVGCGALHVLWEDLAEIRTVAVDPSVKGSGIGHRLVRRLVELARELGLPRLFVLTFETDFFGRHGFQTVDGAPVSPEVYEEMRRSVDAGVAEFLDLANIKPNTLGNTRMLLTLT